MAFKYGLLLFVVAQISTSLALPSCVCTKNLTPVCGSDGQTYNNECFLECAAAKSETQITISKHAPCQLTVPDACVCTFNYLPVCGTDGETYSNECALNCQKERFNKLLEVKSFGPCIPIGPVGVCPAIYSPVCGSDGNTYGNECTLTDAVSRIPGLRRAHDGPCVDKVQVRDI